jgi:hypothetical protein
MDNGEKQEALALLHEAVECAKASNVFFSTTWYERLAVFRGVTKRANVECSCGNTDRPDHPKYGQCARGIGGVR